MRRDDDDEGVDCISHSWDEDGIEFTPSRRD